MVKDVTVNTTNCPVCFPKASHLSESGIAGDETGTTDETNFFFCRAVPPLKLSLSVSLLLLSAAPYSASLCASLALSSSFFEY